MLLALIPSFHEAGVSIATLMGPVFGVFARVMGPPNRQGHGATVAGEESRIARVMGPPKRQGHGARGSGECRRARSIEDRVYEQTP